MGIKKVTAINKMTPRGEKTVEARVLTDGDIDERSLVVPGRTTTGTRRDGDTIYLSLDPNDDKALTRRMTGFGPNTKTKVTGSSLSVKKKGSIVGVKCSAEENEDIDGFKKHTFNAGDGKELTYFLYEPKLRDGEKAPLVLFMHDSSVVSDNPKAALIQGMGGVIWAAQSEQEKRPCYVLVPAYQEKTAFDDFTVTWHCEATAALIEELKGGYAIDENRIYGTGQSMGCMMLYELIFSHPNLFAATYNVAGQWDVAKISQMSDRRMWILISEKDEKAYPIMSEGIRLIEDAGGRVAGGHLDAKASAEDKKAFCDAVIAQGAGIQFTYYEGASNLPDGIKPFPGCYHLCTWLYAYDIEGIREWLFSQSRA